MDAQGVVLRTYYGDENGAMQLTQTSVRIMRIKHLQEIATVLLRTAGVIRQDIVQSCELRKKWITGDNRDILSAQSI